ncbi:hypothetical protein Tco_0950175, partial [Tanacetum coccineum]
VVKAVILSSLPFVEGVLSVRYLGVPLISSRLLYRDCKVLVEKLESRVNDWRNKFLSLAGCLQLIRFVLSSMHIYWASVFILPSRVIHDLEQLMRGFLWCQWEMKRGRQKWLGSRCASQNMRVVLDVPCLGDVSWGWRKLLHIRPTIRPFIWHKIYNGKSTSVRFDLWDNACPLKGMLSNREISRAGFSLSDSVYSLITDDVWRLPSDWASRFPIIAQIQVPVLNVDVDDVLLWKDREGVLRPFSVTCVWDTIRLGSIPIWHGFCSPSPWLVDVITFLTPLSKGRSVISIISRSACSSYCVNGSLVTFKFKKMTTQSRLLLDQWKIPSSCIVHNGSSRRQTHPDYLCSRCVAAGLRDARLIICFHLGSCLA